MFVETTSSESHLSQHHMQSQSEPHNPPNVTLPSTPPPYGPIGPLPHSDLLAKWRNWGSRFPMGAFEHAFGEMFSELEEKMREEGENEPIGKGLIVKVGELKLIAWEETTMTVGQAMDALVGLRDRERMIGGQTCQGLIFTEDGWRRGEILGGVLVQGPVRRGMRQGRRRSGG
ncbi:MAG: hypothetical protein Q9219_001122 [cf. Caloplaca sp. 3 TL-2023]